MTDHPSSGATRRFGDVPIARMDSMQRSINDELVAYLRPERAGTGDSIGGSMSALLRSPRLAEAAGRLVPLIFDGLCIPRASTEMAILLTARHWDCHFLFAMHRRLAVEHGIQSTIVDSVALGERPDLFGDLDNTYGFVAQLLRDGDVDDEMFDSLAERWGLQGAVELIVTVGFYTLLAMVLNVDRHPVPPLGSQLPALATTGRGMRAGRASRSHRAPNHTPQTRTPNIPSGSPGSRRFGDLSASEMDPAQRSVNDWLIDYLYPDRSGGGEAIGGPMSALLRSPKLAEVIGRMVPLMFDGLSLPRSVIELAILVTARHWQCHFVFHTHRRYALDCGIDNAVIDAIARGGPLHLAPPLSEAHTFVAQLLHDGDVSDETFASFSQRWARQGAVELIATVGFYSMLAMVLNVDRHPVPPPGQRLPDLDR